jgi:membrane protein implicated in regulation of membrane protease activity
MATLAGLLEWWNLIFLLPIALSVLLLVASAVGGLGEGHGDASHAHGEVSHDAAGHGEGGADGDHAGFLHEALEWFGVGVVPISLLLQAFLLFFGVFGLAANRALNTASGPEGLIWGALGLATLGGAGSAGLFGALSRRFLPRDEPALGNKDLVGRTGRVVFQVTQTTGTAQVRDAGGTLHQIPARVPAGHQPIEGGQEIIVASYNAEAGAFVVEESPFTLTQEELRRRA